MSAAGAGAQLTSTNERSPLISTDETDWGYIVRCQSCDNLLKVVTQWSAAFFGVLFIAGAIGLWVLPGSVTTSDVTGIKLAMSALSGGLGVALLWFASHGTRSELQVNLVRSELREVLRNTRGRAKVQNRTRFEDINEVFIDGTPMKDGRSRLLLRLSGSEVLIEVAYDHEEYLVRLCDRLCRDILEYDELARA